MRGAAAGLAVALAWAGVAACGRDQPAPPPDPDAPFPHARADLVESLLLDRAAVRHPADGAGRAWLEAGARVRAGQPARFELVYEAGPLGVADGGGIYLMTSPFWGWDTPQVVDPAAPGYTEVSSTAQGVRIEAETVDAQLLVATVRGRPLAAGERVRFVLGAGPAGALADRFAEQGERLWVAVDGDGDRVRRVLDGSPSVEVLPGPPARLVLFLPATARPGERVRGVAALLDAEGSAGAEGPGALALELPAGLEGPARVVLADGGRADFELVARSAGVLRVRGRAGELSAESNPLVVGDGPRILWGDLHGHSNLSDGTGTPADWFRYARDAAALDVAALTDHDHWGVHFLDERPELWEEIRAQVRRFHAPGLFVALLAYEWTSWLHGHRHVVYFQDEGRVLSSLDEASDDPRELWAALRGLPVLTFAHHSAGGPIPTNWAIPPDPELEPVTEIASVHGASEALDAPGLIYSVVPGNTVRDVLDRGVRLGFVGSGDGHDGHPGLTHLAPPGGAGGLAGIFAEERTREAVLSALRARRSFATNGPRIALTVELAGRSMGSTIPRAELRSGAELVIRVAAPAPLDAVEVIRGGRVETRIDAQQQRDLALQVPVGDLAAGDYVYVRVVQGDGGAAWSSPFFVE